MSFDPRFDFRWKKVITPAIQRILLNDVPLEPYRVDVSRVSDSILTEILDGIANCRLILADITTIGAIDGRVVRNGNVMYEVGIAHAVRLPEEVILFRSDKDSILFDLSNIRVNQYFLDDNPEEAMNTIQEMVMSSFREIELKKHLAITKATNSLDFVSWLVLLESASGGIKPPRTETIAKAVGNAAKISAIERLLEMGALTTSILQLTPEMIATETPASFQDMMQYKITSFGEAVIDNIAEKLGVFSPDVQTALEYLSGGKQSGSA